MPKLSFSCADFGDCPDESECHFDENGCGTCVYEDEQGGGEEEAPAPPENLCETDDDCPECSKCNGWYCEPPNTEFQCQTLGLGQYEGCKEGEMCIEDGGKMKNGYCLGVTQ